MGRACARNKTEAVFVPVIEQFVSLTANPLALLAGPRGRGLTPGGQSAAWNIPTSKVTDGNGRDCGLTPKRRRGQKVRQGRIKCAAPAQTGSFLSTNSRERIKPDASRRADEIRLILGIPIPRATRTPASLGRLGTGKNREKNEIHKIVELFDSEVINLKFGLCICDQEVQISLTESRRLS